MHVLRWVAVALCSVCCLPAMARADNGNYIGQSTVVSVGETPQTCIGRNMLISVNGGTFSFGRPAVATGTVQPDGSFSASFSSGTGQRIAQFAVSGRIDGAKATGTITGSTGCKLSFDLRKQ